MTSIYVVTSYQPPGLDCESCHYLTCADSLYFFHQLSALTRDHQHNHRPTTTTTACESTLHQALESQPVSKHTSDTCCLKTLKLTTVHRLLKHHARTGCYDHPNCYMTILYSPRSDVERSLGIACCCWTVSTAQLSVASCELTATGRERKQSKDYYILG
jgi:hypothetical protein